MLTIEQERKMKKRLDVSSAMLDYIQDALSVLLAHIDAVCNEKEGLDSEMADALTLLKCADKELVSLHNRLDRKLFKKDVKPQQRRKYTAAAPIALVSEK